MDTRFFCESPFPQHNFRYPHTVRICMQIRTYTRTFCTSFSRTWVEMVIRNNSSSLPCLYLDCNHGGKECILPSSFAECRKCSPRQQKSYLLCFKNVDFFFFFLVGGEGGRFALAEIVFSPSAVGCRFVLTRVGKRWLIMKAAGQCAYHRSTGMSDWFW